MMTDYFVPALALVVIWLSYIVRQQQGTIRNLRSKLDQQHHEEIHGDVSLHGHPDWRNHPGDQGII